MFGLDPFNPAVAIGEMVLLLIFAALVGWLLGRLVLGGRVSSLQSSIDRRQSELDECRRAKRSPVATPATSAVPPTPAYESARPEPSVPPAFVPADPLLPVINQDDTPELIQVDPLPVVPADIPPTIAPNPDVLANDPPAEALPARAGLEVPAILPPVPAPVVSTPLPTNASPTGNSEAAVLNRIAARVNELNFDRIGRATAAEADDLKDIVGVGPFLERKLHSLGIYTFRQVSNFTKEDVAKVNDIIEFFPGRIERDNWVEQSRVFHERKYGAKS